MAPQEDRRFNFNSPLGDSLRFLEMRGTEQLGRTFAFTIHLVSLDPDIKLSDLLGQGVSVSIDLAPHSDTPRFFHGIVTRFQREGKLGNHYVYSAHVAPWLWLLSYTTNCRIFQNLSVPEIVKAVFRTHKISDFAESPMATYKAREYVTQYDETDLEFVSRLMEDEGIYYFFKHEETKHTLVLADAPSHHAKVPGYEDVFLLDPTHDQDQDQDHIDRWSMWNELQSGGVVLSDFDFKNPRADLLTKCIAPNPHEQARHEVYWHPGDYTNHNVGMDRCRLRIEELNARYEQIGGAGDVRGIGVGDLFNFVEDRIGAAKHEYLVEFASYDIRGAGYETSTHGSHFRFEFAALDSQRQFRPERRFRAKKMYGPQTATVVGDKGEDITTDKYGRVRVKFHWDRRQGNEQDKGNVDKNNNDPNSSCLVRVAQMWAGANFGAINIPRIGDEVIVDFLEGDPDRPIITGRVYNGDNMPPYTLPDKKTQTGIKSRSTKGGNPQNFNELRFEDLKGSEEVHLQAEKDLTILVKNNETRDVGHDRVKNVKHDETSTITGNRTEEVFKDEKISIHGGRIEMVDKDENITITGARKESVGKDETISITGARTETVSKDEKITITGARQVDVGKAETLTVGAGRQQTITGDDQVKVSKRLLFDAGDEVVIKTGSASITMKKDGTIVLKGKDVSISASGKINVAADGETIIKGSKVGHN
jgi:type VI secretion system secreted protein VgrG